jgi:hypothetical protein
MTRAGEDFKARLHILQLNRRASMQGTISIETSLPSQLARLPCWEEQRRWRRAWIALLIAIVIWGLTDVRRRARIDPKNPAAHKTDFTVYTEAGAAFFDGRDPYDVANPRGWHYLYPPLFAILAAPLAAFDTQIQAVVWYFVSVAACFGIWRECRKLWRWLATNGMLASARAPERHGGRSLQRLTNEELSAAPPAWLGWLAAATVALPVMNCLQRGQVGVVLGYLLLVGLRLVVASETMRGVFVGGAALSLAVTIKLTPILPAGVLALALLIRAWRNHHGYAVALAEALSRGPMHRAVATIAGGCVGLLLFVLIIPGCIVGHAANIAHLRTWGTRVVTNDEVGIDNDFNMRSKRNQSLANAVRRLGNRVTFATGAGPDDRLVDDLAQQSTTMPMENAAMDAVLRVAAIGLVALLLVAGWRVAGRDDASGLAALFGLACTATLLVSPISWGHHYVVWLPALVFVPRWMWNNDLRALAVGMAEAALVLVAAHYIFLDHAGRVGLLGIGTAIWYLVATVSLGWATGTRTAEKVTVSFEGGNAHGNLRRRAA